MKRTPQLQKTARCLVFTALVGCMGFPLLAQVEGCVYDARTGMPLAHANVYDYVSGMGAVTDEQGCFRIDTKADSVRLRISHVGYHEAVVSGALPFARPLKVRLEPGRQLPQAEVVAQLRKREEFFSPEKLAYTRLSAKDVLTLPTLGGEPDLMRTLLALPGVQAGIEGQSSFFVRGGLRDQNLLLLDGEPLYYTNHFFGFLSVLNPDALADVQFYRGGFPARYGGRLSSVIDLSLHEGVDTAWQLRGGVGLLSGRVVARGPLGPRMNLLAGARRTWFDLLFFPIARLASTPTRGLQRGKAFFHDYNLKLTFKPEAEWKLWASLYSSRDLIDVATRYSTTTFVALDSSFTSVVEEGYLLGWGNLLFSAAAQGRIAPRLRVGIRVGRGQAPMKYGTAASRWQVSNVDSVLSQARSLQSSVSDWRMRLWARHLSAHHRLEAGLSLRRYRYIPYRSTFSRASADTAHTFEEQAETLGALGGACYLQDEYSYGRLAGMAGVRLSAWQQGAFRTWALEPRLSLRWSLSEDLALQGSWVRMVQYEHMAHGTRIALPSDRWLPASERFPPQSSWLYSLGAKLWWSSSWQAAVEVWYKTMDDIVMYADGADPLMPTQDYASQLARGQGWARGLEMSLYADQSHWSGRMHYTYARTRVQFAQKNGGLPFFPPFDRRHKLDIQLRWQIRSHLSLSANWIFASGAPMVIPTYRIETTEFFLFSALDQYRFRPTHRLDLSLQRRKDKRHFTYTWVFGLYNAYGRRNALFVAVLTPPGKSQGLYEISWFPILPFVSLRFASSTSERH